MVVGGKCCKSFFFHHFQWIDIEAEQSQWPSLPHRLSRPPIDATSGLLHKNCRMGPPSDVISWFINHEIIPMNTIDYSYIYHKPSFFQPLFFAPTERELVDGGPAKTGAAWTSHWDHPHATSCKVVPQFGIAKLVKKIPISLGLMNGGYIYS